MKRVKWVEGQFGPKYLGEYRNNFRFIFFFIYYWECSRSQQLVDTVQGSESLAGPRGLLEAYKLDIAVICRGLLYYQLEDSSLCTPAFSKVS